MSNPYINVLFALWGSPAGLSGNPDNAPNPPLDVTANVQAIFDYLYLPGGSPVLSVPNCSFNPPNNQSQGGYFTITPSVALFSPLSDPSPSNTKTFTITYQVLIGTVAGEFSRACPEGSQLNIYFAPVLMMTINAAYYGNGSAGIDVTSGLQNLVNDPMNAVGQGIQIGGPQFLSACTGGGQVSNSQCFLMVYYTTQQGGEPIPFCGQDGTYFTLIYSS
jgi:hypothetical protein